MLGELPPLAALLSVYTRESLRPWHALCWLLDQRLSAVVRRGGDPTIAAIRLAWWDAVLVEGDRSKGGGEPLVEAWRAAAPEGTEPLAAALIDGWRTLLGEEALSDEDLVRYGEKRGAGLFHLISAQESASESALAAAGTVWALWDLAGHASEPALASAAIGQAKAALAAVPLMRRDAMPRPLRLLYALAAADARSGRVPLGGFQARHYRALLWRSLLP